MKKSVMLLGALVFTALMYCVPALLTCSFLLNWDSFVKYLLCIAAIWQFSVAVILVYFNTSDGNNE